MTELLCVKALAVTLAVTAATTTTTTTTTTDTATAILLLFFPECVARVPVSFWGCGC